MTLFVTAKLTKELSVRKNMSIFENGSGYLTYYIEMITRYLINTIRFIK